MKREIKTGRQQNLLVVGANGATGYQVVRYLLECGHRVTAFSRSASRIDLNHPELRKVDGDATRPDAVKAVLAGHDAVIVTLGIAEHPLLVRFFGSRKTPMMTRSRGTQAVIEAMADAGVDRLVVQTSFGVGATRDLLRFAERLLFRLVLKPQMDDTERQEQLVRNSDTQWTLVQPVHLSDDKGVSDPYVSTGGGVRRMIVSRCAVARVLAGTAIDSDYTRQSVAVSG